MIYIVINLAISGRVAHIFSIRRRLSGVVNLESAGDFIHNYTP
jgi:hypothetical protein